jgi:hypothetical protein
MMASLELVDHTQHLERWHLPQQQHGVRQPPARPDSHGAEAREFEPSKLSAE